MKIYQVRIGRVDLNSGTVTWSPYDKLFSSRAKALKDKDKILVGEEATKIQELTPWEDEVIKLHYSAKDYSYSGYIVIKILEVS